LTPNQLAQLCRRRVGDPEGKGAAYAAPAAVL